MGALLPVSAGLLGAHGPLLRSVSPGVGFSVWVRVSRLGRVVPVCTRDGAELSRGGASWTQSQVQSLLLIRRLRPTLKLVRCYLSKPSSTLQALPLHVPERSLPGVPSRLVHARQPMFAASGKLRLELKVRHPNGRQVRFVIHLSSRFFIKGSTRRSCSTSCSSLCSGLRRSLSQFTWPSCCRVSLSRRSPSSGGVYPVTDRFQPAQQCRCSPSALREVRLLSNILVSFTNKSTSQGFGRDTSPCRTMQYHLRAFWPSRLGGLLALQPSCSSWCLLHGSPLRLCVANATPSSGTAPSWSCSPPPSITPYRIVSREPMRQSKMLSQRST